VAELHFYTGPMDCGKSTLALQTDHNHTVRGRAGVLFSSHDRAGSAMISSRLGLARAAVEVDGAFDFWVYVVDRLSRTGDRVDYLVCDEAQFYTREQVDQLAAIADDLGIDVFCFGILTDFRARLFEGSARLVEMADRTHTLQVESLCWCGRRATHNARTVDGQMVTEGDVVVVGDTAPDADQRVGYEVLCRRHHRSRVTSARVGAVSLAPIPLPFGDGGDQD
jgi:thymidine kinase